MPKIIKTLDEYVAMVNHFIYLLCYTSDLKELQKLPMKMIKKCGSQKCKIIFLYRLCGYSHNLARYLKP